MLRSVAVVEKNDSFKIMKNTKELVSDVVEFSRNFPKSESVLKKNLQDELFNLVRLLNSYIVNRDSSRIREKHIKDFIVSLSMVDYYFEYLYLNKIISFKKYKDLVGYVVTIRKLAYGMIKNEKELC